MQTSTNTPEIVSIVGARPQFVKLAPIARCFDKLGTATHRVINTGQHYDDAMSQVFFDELALPKPDLDLEVGSGAHGVQTGKMMERLEAEFERRRPDVVLVYGDTNSTLAAVLVAAKMHIPSAHIEAGLRSFNREMPEEINRITADHCSDRLYPPTPTGMANLEDENLAGRAILTGDIMRDAVSFNLGLAREKSSIKKTLELDGRTYGLMTLHRPVNTTVEELTRILQMFGNLDTSLDTIIFPVHPRTKAIIDGSGLKVPDSLQLVEPLPYLDMLSIVESARLVLTDSGGLQKEAAFLETPCITMRTETEWVETLDLKVNILTGTDEKKLTDAIHTTLENESQFDAGILEQLDQFFGAGNAADVIVKDLNTFFS